jgi:hypothetical protein
MLTQVPKTIFPQVIVNGLAKACSWEVGLLRCLFDRFVTAASGKACSQKGLIEEVVHSKKM